MAVPWKKHLPAIILPSKIQGPMFFFPSEARANIPVARPATNNPRGSPQPRSHPYSAPTTKGAGKQSAPTYVANSKNAVQQYRELVVDPTKIFDSFDNGMSATTDPTVLGNRQRAASMLHSALGASNAASTLKGYNDLVKGVDALIKKNLLCDLVPFDNPVRGATIISFLMTLPEWTPQPSDFPTPIWDATATPPDWEEPTQLLSRDPETKKWEGDPMGTPVLYVGSQVGPNLRRDGQQICCPGARLRTAFSLHPIFTHVHPRPTSTC